MVSGRKSTQQLKERINSRIAEVAAKEPLDFKNGCLWCYRERMPGSLYCCEEHEHNYIWYNGKPKEKLMEEN